MAFLWPVSRRVYTLLYINKLVSSKKMDLPQKEIPSTCWNNFYTGMIIRIQAPIIASEGLSIKLTSTHRGSIHLFQLNTDFELWMILIFWY